MYLKEHASRTRDEFDNVTIVLFKMTQRLNVGEIMHSVHEDSCVK